MKIIALLFFTAACSPFALASTEFINAIPDFTQTHIANGEGEQYCAPVSVSNSLIWLSKGKMDQRQLIEKLASRDYMNTHSENGTSVSDFLRGVRKISRELYQDRFALEYQGWRPLQENKFAAIISPDIEWIKAGITQKSTVWLNIGWYKYNRGENQYLRVGGHWVTLVGSEERKLILHDPAPRAGDSFANEFVDYQLINSGLLVGKQKGLPVAAKGFYRLAEGMHVKASADMAIVDGAVRLQLLP